MITDIELSRAANALSTTLADQRPPSLDPARCQQIVDGALGGEHKLIVRPTGGDAADLVGEDGRVLGRIERRDGVLVAMRTVNALDSDWAKPS